MNFLIMYQLFLTFLQIAKLREQDEQHKGEIKRYIMITSSQGSCLVPSLKPGVFIYRNVLKN